MAGRGKSGSGIGTAIGIIVALFGGYILLKWLSAPRTATVPGGFVGGSYGGASASNPYGQQSSGNLLAALLAGLMGRGGTSGGSKPPAALNGSFAPLGRLAAGPNYSALQAQSIIGLTQIANNMPLAELNGASLASYEPYYNTDYQIPFDNSGGQVFDVNQLATPVDWYGAGGAGAGLGSGLDTTSYDTGSIDYQPTDLFDVSQMAY